MKRALLISVVALWACDPSVTPIDKRQEQELTATATQTRVVWVLDNSGSMLDKVDPACPGSSCATRIQTVADGLAVMINTAPIDQQIALVFPGGGGQEQCTASRDPYDLTGQNVDTFLRLQAPTGGTPTTEALTKVANIPEPAGTETFVVLVTDGLPNCNPDNPNNICVDTSDEQKNRCRCVSGSCSGQLCSLGCLDEVGVIEASQWFGPHGQQLMAIAFGTDLANLSSPFTSMGSTLVPRCSADADCSVGTCSRDGSCSSRTFSAKTAIDFAPPGEILTEALTRSRRCSYFLGREVVNGSLRITVDDQDVPSTDVSLLGSGTKQHVVISGSTCDSLINSSSVPKVFFLPPP